MSIHICLPIVIANNRANLSRALKTLVTRTWQNSVLYTCVCHLAVITSSRLYHNNILIETIEIKRTRNSRRFSFGLAIN